MPLDFSALYSLAADAAGVRTRLGDQDAERGIELAEAGRFSSETARRNGARRSTAAEHSVRIVEDISNGMYECAICMENLEAASPMWDCRKCFQVFHYDCTSEWARSRVHGYGSNWKCPTCKTEQRGLPESTCWCGTHEFPNAHFSRLNLPPNSCDGPCARLRGRTYDKDCPHSYLCNKTCHAGPCSKCIKCNSPDGKDNSPDEPVYENIPLEPEVEHQVQLSCLETIRFRMRHVPNGNLRVVCVSLIPFIIINIGLITWLLLRIGWITEPYNHHKYADGGWVSEQWAIVFSFLVFMPVNTIISSMLGVAIGLTGEHVFNTTTWKRDFEQEKPWRGFAKGLLNVTYRLLFAICIPCIFLYPILSFGYGPGQVWHNKMSHSCDGFDIRVPLDGNIKYTDHKDSSYDAPNTTLSLHAPGKQAVLPPLHIGSHIQYTEDATAHYQYFFRISGSTPDTEHIAVDFDYDNRVWRMLHLKTPDITNSWSASNYTALTSTPVFHPHPQTSSTSSYSQIKNGTWSQSTSVLDHSLILPELELQIPHWYDFTQNCAHEPFLKVHRTSNMEPGYIRAQADKIWSQYSDSTVVMRTASFGHAQRKTDVCVKNVDWEEGGEVYRGLGDDFLVPLGLIATYRLRMYSEGLRSFCWDDYYPEAARQTVLT